MRCPVWSSASPGLQVLIVGRGNEEELREKADGFAGHLRFLGQVDDAGKASALRSAERMCAHLGGESFGIVLVEAMAAGTPVVASDLDAFRQVLHGGEAGRLVKVDDSAALAEGLIAVLRTRHWLSATPRRELRRCNATTGPSWPTRSCGSMRRSRSGQQGRGGELMWWAVVAARPWSSR